MSVLGYMILAVTLGLMIVGIVKTVEWRVKKVYKQLHSKESDNT